MTDIDSLLLHAEEMPEGPAKVALLEQAVGLADVAGDVERSFSARMQLIPACEFSGEFDKALVAFSWCLVRCDEQADRFPVRSILWYYKWIATGLPTLTTVSRAQILEATGDLERRFLAAGAGPVPALKVRWENALTMGDLDAARDGYERWQSAPRRRGRAEYLSDCEACDKSTATDLWNELDDDRAAIATARPVLDGEMSCIEEPHRVLGKVLIPYLRTGDAPAALAAHKRGYPLVRSNPNLIGITALHILYRALVGDDDAVASMLELHASLATRIRVPLTRLNFCSRAGVAVEMRGKPPDANLVKAARTLTGGEAAAAELGSWLVDQAREIACAFDRRNGNGHLSGRIEALRELRRLRHG